MPIIFLKSSPASSGERASFTPPPFPRPPAWIWAFTTTTPFPPAISSRAAATASSAEVTSLPRGTATPNPRRISLAWYSWIFMAAPPVHRSVWACKPECAAGREFTTWRILGTARHAGYAENRRRSRGGRLAQPARSARAVPSRCLARDGDGRRRADAGAALRRRRERRQALRRFGDAVGLQPRRGRHHDPWPPLARVQRARRDRLRGRRRRIRLRRRAADAHVRTAK